MILICGDSGSGKTELAKMFGLPVLECDRYHKWERGDYHWKYYTHLNPAANELSLMKKHVISIKEGKCVTYRDYNHLDGRFTEPMELPSGKIVVCGLHTFVLDGIKIFVSTDQDLKTLWKINRDFKERGHSIQSILDKINQRKLDYENYILPQMKQADYVVHHRWQDGLKTEIFHNDNLIPITKFIEEVKNGNL